MGLCVQHEYFLPIVKPYNPQTNKYRTAIAKKCIRKQKIGKIFPADPSRTHSCFYANLLIVAAHVRNTGNLLKVIWIWNSEKKITNMAGYFIITLPIFESIFINELWVVFTKHSCQLFVSRLTIKCRLDIPHCAMYFFHFYYYFYISHHM